MFNFLKVESECQLKKNLKVVPKTLKNIDFSTNVSSGTLKRPEKLFNKKLTSPDKLFKDKGVNRSDLKQQ